MQNRCNRPVLFRRDGASGVHAAAGVHLGAVDKKHGAEFWLAVGHGYACHGCHFSIPFSVSIASQTLNRKSISSDT